MELELGLSLPTYSFIESFGSDNNGFQKKEMAGLKSLKCEDGYLDNKRRFEEAFGKMKDGSKELPLSLWCGQNNDEDDRKGSEKKKTSCNIKTNDEEGNEVVVGWPPIKSWRKKVLHQEQRGHVVNSNRMAANGNENGGSNSKYVKVKMEGVAITRKIDLRLYISYQALTNSLIGMFAKCQKIEKDAARYTLTYQDKDGDWLIAGDVPWQTFIESVQRLEIVRSAG